MSHARAHTLKLIQSRRALGLAERRRGRLPRQIQPDAIRREYFNALDGLLVRAWEPAFAILRAELPSIVEEARRERGDTRARRDASGQRGSDLVRRAARRFAEQFRPSELEALAGKFGKRTSDFQRAQLARQVKAATGVDVVRAEPWLAPRIASFTAENVDLITTIQPTLFGDVSRVVRDGVRSGQLHGDMARDIEARFNVSESRAKLIARDQVGKFYGDLNRTRQKALGIDRFIWRTANDNRVREEHEERDGEAFAWSDLGADEWPGQPINCRCYAEPDLSELLAGL